MTDNIAIFYIELFYLTAGVVINDLTIGKHTIRIKKNGLNSTRFFHLLFRVLAENLFQCSGINVFLSL